MADEGPAGEDEEEPAATVVDSEGAAMGAQTAEAEVEDQTEAVVEAHEGDSTKEMTKEEEGAPVGDSVTEALIGDHSVVVVGAHEGVATEEEEAAEATETTTPAEVEASNVTETTAGTTRYQVWVSCR